MKKVYVSRELSLPLELISGIGRTGCRRCGSAGYFKFIGDETLILCPCARKKVLERAIEARNALAETTPTPDTATALVPEST